VVDAGEEGMHGAMLSPQSGEWEASMSFTRVAVVTRESAS
jgi:hypothetical protein